MDQFDPSDPYKNGGKPMDSAAWTQVNALRLHNMRVEALAEVIERIHPPSGFTESQVRAACIAAAKGEPAWRAEADAAYGPDQAEQRKHFILKSAVKARDAILGRDR